MIPIYDRKLESLEWEREWDLENHCELDWEINLFNGKGNQNLKHFKLLKK